MPGNVPITNKDSLDDFPIPGLRYSSYAVAHNRHCLISIYPDGSVQAASDVAATKRTWQIEMRPKAYFATPETQSQLDALRAFYDGHVALPFMFLDLHSGQRYAAVFTSPWQETSALGRYTVALTIQEVY